MPDLGRVAHVLVEPAVGVDVRGREAHVLVEPVVGVSTRAREAHVLVEAAMGDTSRFRVSMAVLEVFYVPAAYTVPKSVQDDPTPRHQGEPTKGVPR